MLKDYFKIKYLENKLISKNDRFKLSDKESRDILKNFKNSNLLIIGAAGSIGNHFVLTLLNFGLVENLYLLDKDENQLTELNRSINTKNLNKKTKINYICADVITFNFKYFLKNNEINHILNFSALKHVRSEENENSLKYMFLTNSAYFLNFKMHNTVKSIFSVSTDKAIDPTSMLGVSKKLMEHTLYEIKKKNKKIIVSSSRFTNVSFSNGSILKYVMEKFYQNQKIGLPANIKRYFITHDEAISLCLKALTKQSKNFIILPSDYSLKKALSIKKISFQLLKILEKKYQINFNLKNIRFEKSPTQGQKINEDIQDIDEVYQNYDKSKKILKTAFVKNKHYKKIIEDIFKSKTRAEFDKIAKKISKNFKFKNQKKVSEIL